MTAYKQRLGRGLAALIGDDADADDDGLVLPPRLAPKHVVISPIYRSDDDRGQEHHGFHRWQSHAIGEAVYLPVTSGVPEIVTLTAISRSAGVRRLS